MTSRGKEAMLALRSGAVADDDRRFYLDLVELRVRLLEEDEPIFGLIPAEQTELAELKAFLEEA